MYTKDNILSKKGMISGFQLSKLHTFESAARHGSFSLAAEELALTPSAVSHRINKLEAEIGIQLFVRSHRKISLTEEGGRIYQTLKKTLNALNQEIFDVKNGDVSGPLCVYCRPSFAQSWLVPRIGAFKALYPSLALKLLTGNEKINFQEHGIDVAIYFDDKMFDEKMSDKLFCQEIFAETIIPVCSAQYAEQHGLLGSPERLRYATLLHDNQAWDYDSDADEWKTWAQVNQFEGVSQISRIDFDRSDLAVIAAVHHAGVAMGRFSQVQPLLSKGELVTPFPGTEVSCRQKYYVAAPLNRHSQKVKLFIDWLVGQTN